MPSAFQQPASPGYSPFPLARQDSPFLRMPGAQGLQEGITAGQGVGFSPQAQFFGGGMGGTAPPSSIPPQGAGMWNSFGGAGGAPTSLQPQQQAWSPQAQAQASGMMKALQGGQPGASM